MDVRVGPQRRLNAKEFMLMNSVVLEKTLESPLDSKEIQPVQPKGNQSWMFIGRTDTEAKTPVLWPPDAKSWLIGKDPDAGRDWGQEEEGMTEDEMAGWHHQLNGHVWLNSGSWWWTGRPGTLWFMGLQRVGHDWATELNWTDALWKDRRDQLLGRMMDWKSECNLLHFSWIYLSSDPRSNLNRSRWHLLFLFPKNNLEASKN